MIGPFKRGWAATVGEAAFKGLIAGQRYVVVEEFNDFDGDSHPEGETWTFLGASFVPHDDGQSLFVSLDGESEWHIRLQWRDKHQGEILDQFERYVAAENGR